MTESAETLKHAHARTGGLRGCPAQRRVCGLARMAYNCLRAHGTDEQKRTFLPMIAARRRDKLVAVVTCR